MSLLAATAEMKMPDFRFTTFGACYNLFLNNDDPIKTIKENYHDFMLRPILEIEPYVKNKELRIAILEAKRKVDFERELNQHNSLIMNEVKGIYALIKTAKSYWRNTRAIQRARSSY